jgi:hypothetical protein
MPLTHLCASSSLFVFVFFPRTRGALHMAGEFRPPRHSAPVVELETSGGGGSCSLGSAAMSDMRRWRWKEPFVLFGI